MDLPKIVIDVHSIRSGEINLYDKYRESLTRCIEHDYAEYAPDILDQAIAAGHCVLNRYGTFIEAMNASEAFLRCYGHGADCFRNSSRLTNYLEVREEFVSRLFYVVVKEVRAAIPNSPALEAHQAMVRARRVLEGGGSIGVAIYHALG